MGLDEQLLVWINSGWAHPLLDVVFHWLSSRPGLALPLLVFLLLYLWRDYGGDGVKLWGILLLVVVGGDAFGATIKDLTGQYRPCYDFADALRQPPNMPWPCGDTTTGFPSNHALNYFSVALFMFCCLPRKRLWLVLAAIAVAVGLSRVYLAKHYPSQVVAGALIGVAFGYGSGWLTHRYLPFARRIRRMSALSLFRFQLKDRPRMTSEATAKPHRLSVVIPLYNEEESVMPLMERVHEALNNYPHPWELVLVDDGSGDATTQRVHETQARFGDHIHLVELQRNFGQTAAMQAGIDYARGDIIATMDGDLQNDPIDIPRMVSRLLDEDLDLVVGWRRDRKDNLWQRKIPSRIANHLIGRITKVELHDYGCSLKIYRSNIIKGVRLYGEMHRFIPAWVATNTSPARIKEEVVTHHAPQFGESKYGISRTFRVILDLISVYFFMRYRARPGHFFGKIGFMFGGLGGLILAYLIGIKLFLGEDIGTRPLLMAGVLLVVVAVQFMTTGVLAELMTRTYFESSNVRSYVVRARRDDRPDADETWKIQS